MDRSNDDERWMRCALDVAEHARTDVSPNPLVGCVIVRDGDVVGAGWTRPPGGPHGEAVALAAAGARARGATAYTTLEPCAHTGRTPPCSDALIDAGIARVVIAAADPNPLASGGAAQLRTVGITVTEGVLREAAEAQNEVFLHGLSSARPFVVAKAAVSLDGRIAAADGTSQWLTGEAARARAHELRAEVDAVIVGSGTVLADDPALTCRTPGYAGPQPVRVVLDASDRVPASARVRDADAPTVIVGTERGENPLGTASWRDLPADTVATLAVGPGPSGGVDLRAALDALRVHLDVRSVLVEGGSAVLSSALRGHLVDRLEVHVAPVLLGAEGRPLLAGPWTTGIDRAPRFTTRGVTQAGDDVLLTLAPRPRPQEAA